jgi:cobalt-zinc-cadmium efflux system outer membrane protein
MDAIFLWPWRPRQPVRGRRFPDWPGLTGTLAFLLVLAGIAAGPARAEGAGRSSDPSPALSFAEVARRVLAANPRLEAAALEVEAARVREDQAGLVPALELGLEVENALGSGDFKGFDGAEFTLDLGRVFERGGKREGRRSVATAATSVAGVELRLEALDLLAETGRRFLAVAVAQEQLRLARERRDQAASRRAAAAARVTEARSPRTELLDAELRQADGDLTIATVNRRLAAARESLAALWVGQASDTGVALDLYTLPEPRDFPALKAGLAALPDLERYAVDERLREAGLRLARAQAVADWRWSLGVRHLEDSGDQALVAGFSVPLGESRRARPVQREAELALARTALDRASRARELEDLLHGQWQLLGAARETVAVITTELLPRARESLELLERGYRIGRFPYRDLVEAEDRLAELEARRLAAAQDYHAARIEIERLSGAHLNLLED